jgi:hypothetical protein
MLDNVIAGHMNEDHTNSVVAVLDHYAQLKVRVPVQKYGGILVARRDVPTCCRSIGRTERTCPRVAALLVAGREHVHVLPLCWSHGENMSTCCLSVGRTERRCPRVAALLVARREHVHVLPLCWSHREYSHVLPLCWSHGENVPTCCRSVGRTERIFPRVAAILVARREYSHVLPLSWSHREYPHMLPLYEYWSHR